MHGSLNHPATCQKLAQTKDSFCVSHVCSQTIILHGICFRIIAIIKALRYFELLSATLKKQHFPVLSALGDFNVPLNPRLSSGGPTVGLGCAVLWHAED